MLHNDPIFGFDIRPAAPNPLVDAAVIAVPAHTVWSAIQSTLGHDRGWFTVNRLY